MSRLPAADPPGGRAGLRRLLEERAADGTTQYKGLAKGLRPC